MSTEDRKKEYDYQEITNAQTRAQESAHSEGPLIDMREGGREILEKLSDLDLEAEDGEEWEDLEDVLHPFLPQSQMLADHDGEYYDSMSRELLNENLAERLISSRDRGRLLRGPFLETAMYAEHDGAGPSREPLSPQEREVIRSALVDARTDRQSLEGTLLEALTEMHVSSEVHKDTDDDSNKNKGFVRSVIPGL